MTSPIVSISWLHENLNDHDLVILDVRQNSNKSNLKADTSNECIPGARSLDLKKDFSAEESIYPNTIPSSGHFSASCKKLGISNLSKIVVYDNIGIYLSPRIWWLFKIMGHQNIYVLNGGLPEWKNHGLPTEKIIERSYPKTDYKINYDEHMIRSFQNMEANVSKQTELVIDARSSDRFYSLVPEPRAGLRSGNIPHSINIHFKEVLSDGKFKSQSEIEKIFHQATKEKRPLVFSCGSGITASILYLAHELISSEPKSIFDGSWTEWAMRKPK